MGYPGFERLQSSLNGLKESLERAKESPESFSDGYVKMRRWAFEVEMLGKLYRKARKETREAFESIRLMGKEIEDLLGEYGTTDELHMYVMGLGPGVPEDLREFLNQRKLQHRGETIQLLEELGWTPQDGQAGAKLREIAQLLESIEWKNPAKDRRFLGKRLSKKLEDIQDIIDEGSFFPENGVGYSLDEVETKVHKLRRIVRMIPMYFIYTKGAFVIATEGEESELLIEDFRHLLDNPIANESFSGLPVAGISQPYLVPQSIYLAISEMVRDLGKAKDIGGNIQKLAHLYQELKPNLAPDDCVDAARGWVGMESDYDEITIRHLDRSTQTQMFSVLGEHLQRQINH